MIDTLGDRLFSENGVHERYCDIKKRGEVTREYRKLHGEKLHSLHTSPNNLLSRREKSRIRWVGRAARADAMSEIDTIS